MKVKTESDQEKSEPVKVKSESDEVKSESDKVKSESVKLESEQIYMTKPDFNYSPASCLFDKNLCRRSNATLPFAYSNSYNDINQSEDTQNCFESKHTFSKYDGSTNMHDRNDTTNTHLIRHVADFDSYYSVTAQNIQRSYDQYPFLHEQDIKRTRSYACSVAPNNYEEVPINYSNVDYQCSNTCYDQTYTSHFTSSSCYYSDMQYSMDLKQATNEKSFRASDWPTETLSYRPHAQVHSTSGYRPCIKKCKSFL